MPDLLTMPPFWLPLILGLGIFAAILLIVWALRRYTRIRRFGAAYLAGTVLLALTLVLDGERLLPTGIWRSLMLAAVIVLWGFLLYDLVEDLIVERTLRRGNLAVPRLVRDIFRIIISTALVLLAINQVFGVPLNSLVISSTVLSAVLGLALQDLLKNVIAGIALQVERPFSPGDWIQFSNATGKVTEMSWRATRLVTVDNTHISVPNANLAQADLSNFSSISPVQALHAQIALSYQHPPNEVKRALVAAALASEGVLEQPAPLVRVWAYGEYGVTYDIKFWLTDFDRHVDIRDAVMTNVWYFVRRAGLRMPLPVRDVYFHQADASHAADEQMERIARIRQTLASTELLRELDHQELDTLSERVELRIYGRGELLVRQGDHDTTLYIIKRGHVRVMVSDGNGGEPITVNRLGPGDFFGEFSLLTGTPRRATIIAEEDAEMLLVHRDALAPLLEQNPTLPERLGDVLEHRAAQTKTALAENRSVVVRSADTVQQSFVQRIRSLFGLSE